MKQFMKTKDKENRCSLIAFNCFLWITLAREEKRRRRGRKSEGRDRDRQRKENKRMAKARKRHNLRFGHVTEIQFHKRDGLKGNEKEKSANERRKIVLPTGQPTNRPAAN